MLTWIVNQYYHIVSMSFMDKEYLFAFYFELIRHNIDSLHNNYVTTFVRYQLLTTNCFQ